MSEPQRKGPFSMVIPVFCALVAYVYRFPIFSDPSTRWSRPGSSFVVSAGASARTNAGVPIEQLPRTMLSSNEAKFWTRHFEDDAATSSSPSSSSSSSSSSSTSSAEQGSNPQQRGEVWGSYRPYVYFGMKSRATPYALSTGLMWFGAQGPEEGIRHDTAQGELSRFEWLEHDGKKYGMERLVDSHHELEINASFVVVSDETVIWAQRFVAAPTTTIDVKQPELQRREPNSLLLYLGAEGSNNSQAGVQQMLGQTKLRILNVVTATFGGASALTILAHSETLGGPVSLTITARGDPSGSTPVKLSYSGVGGDVTRGVQRLQHDIIESRYREDRIGNERDLSNVVERGASFVAVQVHSLGPITLDAVFRMHETEVTNYNEFLAWANKGEHLADQGARTTAWLAAASLAFNTRFEQTFGLQKKRVAGTGKTGGKPVLEFTPRDILAAKAALSSLLGGIGFFYGTPRIGSGVDVEDADQRGSPPDRFSQAEPITLLSATPSRTAFPRGFLWDEGFHQMLISKWDNSITTEVLQSWLKAMYRFDGEGVKEVRTNINGELVTDPNSARQKTAMGGWIPREMILGDTAARRVPDEFITQRVNIANPPTLLLVVEGLLDQYVKMREGEEKLKMFAFLTRSHKQLHRWVQWFLSTQQGLHENSFRWRGRSDSDRKVIPNTLASGLDDYPRGPVADENERHVDLHTWMARACLTMARLKTVVGVEDDVSFNYSSKAQLLLESLDEMHWSDELEAYADVGVSGTEDSIRREVIFRCGGNLKNPRSVVDVSVPVERVKSGKPFCPETHPEPMYPYSDGKGGSTVQERYVIGGEVALQYIPRMGYVNVFPFLLRLIDPESPKLGAMLTVLSEPKLLWSEHGLRSLSTVDAFYRRNNAPGDAPYWRGPIWININYLALSALQFYSRQPGPEQARCLSVYAALRKNMLRTVLGEYHRTGFLWEQYDDKMGEGIRGHPFSGWTALIVNIMSEEY